MHRWIIACIVLALMAQGAAAEGQTAPCGEASGSDTDYTITPCNVQNNEAFNIVVIGDSIAWGNGLNRKNKYSFLVADWLQEKLNRPVEVTVYAHSGAAITGESGNPIDPNLNSKSPTLMDQAKNIKNKDDVDLILVSGGINDVGIQNIMDANTPAETINSLSESIKDPMANLLAYLLEETNAKIIVTGYYPIITEDSVVEIQDRGVAGALALTSEKTISQSKSALISAVADPTAAKVEAAWYLIEGIANNIDNIGEEDANLRANSDTFYAISSDSLWKAVDAADKGQNRIKFIDPLFERKNSYRASNSFLWELNHDLKTNDFQYQERAELVEKTYALDLNPLNQIKRVENKINPIAHPNRKGAAKYADAIKAAIGSKGLSWLDNSPPMVQSFQVTPQSLTLSESFAIDYTISDNSGSGLKQVELWRKDETSDWQQVSTNPLAGETGPVSGSFTDAPTAPGKYWYGVHVVDDAGNWNDEKNSNTNGQPSGFEPAEVEVIKGEPADATFGSTDSNLALKGDIYYLEDGASSLPDFSALSSIGTIYADALNISPRSFDSGFPGVTDRFEWFAIRYTGKFEVGQEGEYGFRLLSDDGSRLTIDDNSIIDNDGQHSPASASGTVYLTKGVHSIEVEYFQGPRYDIALQLFWTPPGGSESIFDGRTQKVVDSMSPVIQSFQVSPLSLAVGESFSIDYTVSDIDGSGLKQVELWRKDESSDWQQISTNPLDGETGPVSGSFTDSPTAPGRYWYSVHVVDSAGNWNDEKNSNTNGQPNSFEPAEVEAKIAQGTDQSSVPIPLAPQELHKLTHNGWVQSVSFSPDGSKLAAGSDDNTARIWDVANGVELQRLIHDDRVNSLSFSSDGSKLATGSNDKTARIWDAASGEELKKLTLEWAVTSVSLSPDGSKLATGSSDKTARIWDVASGAELQKMTHDNAVWSVSFSPDGSKLATGSGDKTARIWDVANGAELQKVTHDGMVVSVSFSHDGSKLATSSDSTSNDNTARIWDVASGKELKRFTNNNMIYSVTFSPDGSKLATGSYDNTARIWDAVSGAELQVLPHNGWVHSVSFSPDSSKLATGGEDGTVHIWDIRYLGYP
jgi:WD40 repeat protein/lysophospholipase L1-like esterase